MYEIRPESVKTFITDRSVRLPRFQRKQTWDDKKNFQLCISLFKEYPIGVCILSVDEGKGRQIRWLLDGRQRKNALQLMYEDPENIYNWGKRFIGFKNSDQPSEIEDQFYTKINEYIEADPDEQNEELGEDVSESSGIEEDDKIDASAYGLPLLLEIIKIIHNKSKRNTGFTKPFDLTKQVKRLPYVEVDSNGERLISKKVKSFVDEYRKYCDDELFDYEKDSSFIKFLQFRCDVADLAKTTALVKSQWNAIRERMLIVEKIDSVLSNAKIGMIEVKNLSPSDSQKIFNIINSEGEKLTSVEILSAKPHWNIPLDSPSKDAVDAIRALYSRIGVAQEDVVRWDMPASLIKRLKRNYIIKQLTDSKTDFEKELTLGFKILAGIYIGGVKKEDIENLGKNNSINWSSDIEQLIYDLQSMFKLMSSFEYFQYFKSWNTSIMDLTSDAIAIDFLLITYKDWLRKGKPLGDSKAKQFQKNCFILWDRLIYEYIFKQWRGAADNKTAINIANLQNEPDIFEAVPTDKWLSVLNQIFKESAIDGVDISHDLMKPLLYHFYCLKHLSGPDTEYTIEVDHIIPQTVFKESALPRKDVIKDNLLNLGLLPKNENTAKSNKRLMYVESPWLRDQIVKYEFIPVEKFAEYSNLNNYQAMFAERASIFTTVYSTDRERLLNN